MIRLLILSAAFQFLVGQKPQPTTADLDWVETNLRAARDQVMPVGANGQVAAYRVSKDMWTDMVEMYFSIDRIYPDPQSNKESYVATVLAPTANNLRGQSFSQSVRAQLLDLHMADRSAPLETLLLSLSIRRTKLTVGQCPAITSRLNTLRGLSIVVARQSKIVYLHPPAHEVLVSVPGTYINAVFDDDTSSLVHWALGTLDALKKCAA